MKIDKDEILHIAKLANLNIAEEEIEQYQNNLQEILEFTNKINNIDTENINESVSAVTNKNVFREDEIVLFENIEELLQNAPEQENNMFKIPKVI